MREAMKPLSLLLAFFVLLFAYSKFGPNLPISIISQQRGEPMIISESGKGVATPDIARLAFGITDSGTSLKETQNRVNQKSKTVVAELKKLGIEDKDIRTTAYNVFPEYDYNGQPPRITGYRVDTSYEVKIRNFDKVNEALVVVTGSGANLVNNVAFDFSDEVKNKALDEARAEAVEKAKRKAEGLARAAGITLGRIINISESQGFEPPTPILLREAQGGAPDTAVAPEIKPGESEIMVSVSISWEIR